MGSNGHSLVLSGVKNRRQSHPLELGQLLLLLCSTAVPLARGCAALAFGLVS